MERLTIKELASYLPYELKFVSSMDKSLDEYGKQPTWTLNGISEMFGDYCLLTKENNDAYGMVTCKPLLRPLSQLTQERQFGEYWSKIEEIVKESEQHCDAYDEWLEIFIDDPDPSRIMQAPYEVVQEFLEQKFDIFGLLDRSLALPIDGKEVETLTCGYCDSEFSKGTGGNYGENGEVCINCYEGLS